MATAAEQSHETAQTAALPDLHNILAETQQRSSAPGSPLPAVVTAQLKRLTDRGPYVCFDNQAELLARATVPLSAELIGREVVLAFENGDPSRPVIMGVIADPVLPVESTGEAGTDEQTTACVDGTRVVLEGKKEIVLKCGKASITLTRAGKVLIQGAYVSSRSSGVNRMRGGSVHIN